jgi:hypothetical protein
MADFSGLWSQTGESYAQLGVSPALRKRAALLFRRRGMRVDKELLLELNGVAAGQTALSQRTRIVATPASQSQGTSVVNGGARSIETIDEVNRTTAAADVTSLNANIFNEKRFPATYIEDASGNGGGGKVIDAS